ncbi:YopX family protein [Bacillus badius]|uniref:YopX family protein n=1 Tax=Bacillus badius TaxID=1455 RepID=UPI002E20E1E9|nr:YopX family protein [Bacillus badius]
MREIKFRQWTTGWSSGVNRMVYLGDIRDRDFSLLQIGELMQYTGLKDKNGVEIYEGDILEAEHKLKTQKFTRKYRVIFNEKGYWDAKSLDDKPVRLCYAGFDKCEVIGNIYANPELFQDD